MSFITAIGTANPKHRFSQSQIADFMLNSMKLMNGDERKLKAVFRSSGINYRHSVLSDYGKVKDFSFYPEDKTNAFPSTQRRVNTFREHAVELSVDAVKNLSADYGDLKVETITHLVAVSCTGMYAPGLDIDLVRHLNLSHSVQRTAINFMGCYAAFNALKVADAVCRSNEHARVLIVCTELCSLHFQTDSTEDNLLANALFGDGAAAMLVENKSQSKVQLQLETFYSDLFTEGDQAMAWTVGDYGFEMRLSSYVPAMIKKGISKLTNSLLEKVQLSVRQIDYFAIHPGGKRILEAIEEELGISKNDNDAAYKILERYGNMSSASVVFVLKELMNRFTNADHHRRVISFAFGPGLTMESMLLKIEYKKDA